MFNSGHLSSGYYRIYVSRDVTTSGYFSNSKEASEQNSFGNSVLDIHFPRQTQVTVPPNTRLSIVKCHNSSARRYVCTESNVQSTAQM
jgi:hypothetical protein